MWKFAKKTKAKMESKIIRQVARETRAVRFPTMWNSRQEIWYYDPYDSIVKTIKSRRYAAFLYNFAFCVVKSGRPLR